MSLSRTPPSLWALIALVSILILPSLAVAQDTAEADAWVMSPSFGPRIGGYGFRQSDGEGQTNWEDCRMNGVGLFGVVDLNRWLFTEVALDGYYATGDVVDAGMDRISVHTLASIGTRFFPNGWVSPHLQIGGGAEWTRIRMGGAETAGWYPSGFIGTGGELNVVDRLKFGLNLRVFAMTHPEHSHGSDGAVQHALSAHVGHTDAATQESSVREEDASSGVPTSFEMASQLQFYVRFTL